MVKKWVSMKAPKYLINKLHLFWGLAFCLCVSVDVRMGVCVRVINNETCVVTYNVGKRF